MRARFVAALTAVVAVVIGLTAGSPALAATAGAFHTAKASFKMVGNLDSIRLVPGRGVVATGWALDVNNPRATDNLLEMRITYPNGTVGDQELTTIALPRPDVARQFPTAGPNHGFSMTLGYFAAGTYRFCAEVKGMNAGVEDFTGLDKYLYREIGCKTFTMPKETMSGAIESITLQPAKNKPGFWITGWVSDNWLMGEPLVTFIVTRTDAQGNIETRQVQDLTSVARPDVAAAHPELTGIRGFSVNTGPWGSGSFKVCGSVVTNGNNPQTSTVDLGCVNGAFTSVAYTPDSGLGFSSPATVGSTLTFSPGSWTPTPNTMTYSWERGRVAASSSDAYNAPTTPTTPTTKVLGPSDVGHAFHVEVLVSADGLMGGQGHADSDLVTIPGVTTSRIGGADRYSQAVLSSKAAFPDAAAGAPVVYVASGENFPDALSAGPAATHQRGSLLLTGSAALPAVVAAEIRRLHPATIVVVGGPTAVKPAVFASLQKLAPSTIRLTGADRYAVSRRIAEYAFGHGAPSAFIVTGRNYPDALSASGAAASTGVPVLLVNGYASRADSATVSTLSKLAVRSVTIAGGTTAVTPGVAGSLGARIAVSRATGADRYATSIAVNAAFDHADTVYLATGMNYPDGLSGGALAGASNAPLFLATGSCVPPGVISSIMQLKATKVVILGGTNAMRPQLDALYACD
ncbi:cell wall-binding repeat-containing protein [Leifsonia poae]|uniref:cell wall-binding repeat-containing protein n=1 Tax=Leifsonia poae TaxID=110933 RepID=UPI001CBE4793|nr:cell wall-binding repeat-containing protein [Leifsonia poae]